MVITCAPLTPIEPDWEKEISARRAALDKLKSVEAPDPAPLVFRFCASHADDVEAVLENVLAANIKVGTPAQQQLARERLPATMHNLIQYGYTQVAIVSWAIPGVYVVWSAYRRDQSRKCEYRAAVWLMALWDPSEITYLVGDRATRTPAMFFRRQHVVRAAHARAPIYLDSFSVDDRTFVSRHDDDPYPEYINDKGSMVFQLVDYQTAEEMAGGDMDVWAAVSRSNKYSHAAQSVAGEIVSAYANMALKKLEKL